jgi:single stranded DNA-binding protein
MSNNAEKMFVPNINRVMVVAYLTKDPELRYMYNRVPMVSFGVVIRREYFDLREQKTKKDSTFVRVVATDELAERLDRTLKKGSLVFVEGCLTCREVHVAEIDRKFSAVEIRAFYVQDLTYTEKKEEEIPPVPEEEQQTPPPDLQDHGVES